MQPRALARALTIATVAAVAAGGLTTAASAAVGPVLTSTTPAAGSIVKPSGASPVTACFNTAVTGTLTVTGGSGPVAGAPGTATCSSGGVAFSPTLPLADDDYTAAYSVLDGALPPNPGNGSFVFRVDGTAPVAPTFATPAPVTGANASAVSLSGTAEPTHAASGGIVQDTITVALTVTDTASAVVSKSTTTNAAGAFSFTGVDLSGLKDGTLTYVVKATDTAGNTGPTTTRTAVKDTAGPTLSSSVPAANGTHKATSTVVLSFNEPLDEATSTATLADKTTATAATVQTFPDTQSIQLSTSPDTMSEQASPYTVSYTVHDVLGNLATGSFSFSIDDTKPGVPTSLSAPPIVVANQNAYAVSGSAEPGSTASISVTDGTHTVSGSAPVADNGSFTVGSLDVSGLTDGAPITVAATATDAAGNVSDPASVPTTKDGTAPAAPGAVTMTDPVNHANQATTHVTGTVAADVTSVTVSIDDAAHPLTAPVVVSGITPDSGHAFDQSFDVTSLADGVLTATVTAFDAAGNVSPASTTTATKDSGVPSAPTIAISPKPLNAANAGTATVSGTAEPGSTVHLTLDDLNDATTALSTDVIAGNGAGAYTWSPDVSSLTDGTLTATATATDAAGNSSLPAQDTVSLDRVAPDAPSDLSVPAYADPANVAAFPVGGVAENGSHITVTVTDIHAATAQATGTATDSDGTFSVPVDVHSLAEGALSVAVTATDAAGNVSSPAAGSSTKDTTLPAAPSISAPGLVTTANQATYAVSGTAEPGSTVAVTVDDTSDATPTVSGSGPADPSTGAYTVTLDVTGLVDGALSYAATATDPAGNTGPAGTANGSKDTTVLAPVASSPSPSTKTPATVTVTFNEPLDTAASTIVVRNGFGTSIAGSKSFTDGGRTIVFTPTSPSALGEAGNGADGYVVTVNAADPNGDVANGVTFGFTVDNTPPVAPGVGSVTNPVNAANEGAAAISGTAEKGSSVSVSFGSVDPVSAVTTADGSTGAWAVGALNLSSLPDGPVTYAVTATDAAGNVSSSTTGSVTKDTLPPTKPVVSAVTDPVNAGNVTAVVVSGVAEAGSTVAVVVSDGTHQAGDSTTADDNGAWSVGSLNVSSLSDGTISAVATATDAAGNISDTSLAKTASKDTVVPTAPVVSSMTDPVNAANVTAAAVSGTAEPGSTIAVAVSDGTAQVTKSTSADGNGDWSVSDVDLSALADGTIGAVATATDAGGNVSASSVVKNATKRTVLPGAPTSPRADGGDGTVTVHWAAPSSTGGTPVTHYVVTLTPAASNTPTAVFTTADGTAFAHTFDTSDGVVNGTAYVASIVARTIAGDGPAATASATPKFLTALTIATSKPTVPYGTAITLSGALTRAADHAPISVASVFVYRISDAGTTVRMATLTTNALGKWAMTYKPGSNEHYYARYAGSGANVASQSARVRTNVAAVVRVTTPATSSTSSHTAPLVVKGSVVPRKGGAHVSLYYLDAKGGLHRLSTTTLSSTSTYSFSVPLGRGTWRLVVAIGSTTGNVGGRSVVLTVKRT